MKNYIHWHHVQSVKEQVEKWLNYGLEDINEYIPKLKKDIHSLSIGSIYLDFCQYVGDCIFTGKSPAITYQFLYYAHQLGVAHFNLISHDPRRFLSCRTRPPQDLETNSAYDPQEVQIQIGKSILITKGKFQRDFIDVHSITKCIHLSMILKDRASADFLSTIGAKYYERATTSFDQIDEGYMLYLQFLFNEEKDTENWLHYLLIDADKDEYVAQGRREYVDRIHKPVMRVFLSLHHENQSEFTQALEAALLSWRDYHDTDERRGIPEGWISLPLVAACSLAVSNGFAMEIESDYLPLWMVNGEFDGIELIVS